MDKEQELADIVKNGVRNTRVMLPKNYPENGLLRQVPKVIFENELRNNKSADVKICYGGRIAFRDFSKETDPLKKPPYFMPLSEYEKLRTNDKSGKTDRMGDCSDD